MAFPPLAWPRDWPGSINAALRWPNIMARVFPWPNKYELNRLQYKPGGGFTALERTVAEFSHFGIAYYQWKFEEEPISGTIETIFAARVLPLETDGIEITYRFFFEGLNSQFFGTNQVRFVQGITDVGEKPIQIAPMHLTIRWGLTAQWFVRYELIPKNGFFEREC